MQSSHPCFASAQPRTHTTYYKSSSRVTTSGPPRLPVTVDLDQLEYYDCAKINEELVVGSVAFFSNPLVIQTPWMRADTAVCAKGAPSGGSRDTSGGDMMSRQPARYLFRDTPGMSQPAVTAAAAAPAPARYLFRDTPGCLLYTSPSPRDGLLSRMPSSA